MRNKRNIFVRECVGDCSTLKSGARGVVQSRGPTFKVSMRLFRSGRTPQLEQVEGSKVEAGFRALR